MKMKLNRKLLGGVSGNFRTPDTELWTRRLIYPLINEAARALDEGIVETASEVDLAMVFGTGFAPFRGGPLRYADGIGAGKVAEGLKGFNEERLAPCDLLEKLALQGGDFYSSVESMAETEESSHPPLPPEAD